MVQQQAITYPLDLFRQTETDVIHPFSDIETVCGAKEIKALQVKSAGEQERALPHDLMRAILSTTILRKPTNR